MCHRGLPPPRGQSFAYITIGFGRPGALRCEPDYELTMGINQLQALVQFRLGSHTLPIEQGRFARASPPVPPSPVHRLQYTSCGR